MIFRLVSAVNFHSQQSKYLNELRNVISEVNEKKTISFCYGVLLLFAWMSIRQHPSNITLTEVIRIKQDT